MKKALLIAALAAGTSLSSVAESKLFVFDFLGEVNGVADNGRYAVVTDPDYGACYIWSSDSPSTMKEISATGNEPGFPAGARTQGTTAMDVSDDGVVVGCVQFTDYYHPAYYKDGQWHLLPIDPNAMNTNEAIAITPDGSVIAGYHFIKDPTADQGARFYPCQWFRQDDGSYTLRSYSDLELPNHQGFFPFTQTSDGKVIGGTIYCGVGSRVNALLNEGKLVMFDNVETHNDPFIYKGKYYAGYDENGKQIWVDDINDPRVVFTPTEYIDGFKDGARGDESFLNGFFVNCDDYGNFYGARSRVENLDEDGDGDVFTDAIIYNYLTDTWHFDESFPFFSAGVKDELLFTGDGNVVFGDVVKTVAEGYNLSGDNALTGVNKISGNGTVLGGAVAELNPAIGEYMYYPFIIMTEWSGVESVAGTPSTAMVLAGAGHIEVIGAEDVTVYDIDGRLVAAGKDTYVSAGIYVVTADGNSYKVRVR